MNNKSLLPSYRAKLLRRYKKFEQCFIYSSDIWILRLAKWLRYRNKTRMIMDRAGDEPYLERFYLLNLRPIGRIVIHCFWKSDDDGGLHDHPWRFAASKIIVGGYYEYREDGSKTWCNSKTPMRWFGGKYLHRVELQNEGDRVWTLFIMGPRYRKWGFVPFGSDGKWVYWKDYIAQKRLRLQGKLQ